MDDGNQHAEHQPDRRARAAASEEVLQGLDKGEVYRGAVKEIVDAVALVVRYGEHGIGVSAQEA